MEIRFDSLGADKLASLLGKHASHQTQTLFGQDVRMLRTLLSRAKAEFTPDIALEESGVEKPGQQKTPPYFGKYMEDKMAILMVSD